MFDHIDWTLMLGCVRVGIGGATVAVAVTLLLAAIGYGIRRASLRALGRRRAVVEGDHTSAPTDALAALRARLVDDGHLPREQSLVEQNGHRGAEQ